MLLEEDKFSSLRRRRTWLTCGILCCLVNFSSRPDWEMKFKDSIVLIAREESDWKDTDVAVFRTHFFLYVDPLLILLNNELSESVFGVTQALDPERLDHFVHLLIEMSTHNSQRSKLSSYSSFHVHVYKVSLLYGRYMSIHTDFILPHFAFSVS